MQWLLQHWPLLDTTPKQSASSSSSCTPARSHQITTHTISTAIEAQLGRCSQLAHPHFLKCERERTSQPRLLGRACADKLRAMTLALVTGANRGIGLELTKQLLDRGVDVIAAVRSSSAELSATKAEIVTGVEVVSDDAASKLLAAVGDRTLDILINNAGIGRGSSIKELNVAGVREQFEVNALAPLRLSIALSSCMKQGGKIGLVTSRMGSIADNTSGGAYGYRMSKAALNAAGKSLAVDLAPHGISVALLHPGWVKTDMTGGTGNITAAESASQLIARMDAMNLENSGTFFHANGEVLPF